MNEERFGLPLSLVEALQADASSDAALLASYLTGVSPGEGVAVDERRSHDAAASLLVAGSKTSEMQTEIFSLEQLLEDPLIRLVMASDHVREDDVRAIMRHAHANDGSAGRLIDRLAA